jgi:TPR repeat protein
MDNDFEKAIQRMVKEQGDTGALYKLGKCFMEGDWGPKDVRKAYDLYHKAAEKAYGPALYTLGDCYRDGAEGIPQNKSKAVNLYSMAYMWYEEAAEKYENGNIKDELDEEGFDVDSRYYLNALMDLKDEIDELDGKESFRQMMERWKKGDYRL